ncbi:hypothetical protein ACFWG6_02290 [Streptomyces erythrochromogenes]|uniref:hypothetical protein n=1 Tax=Streptomyces erythrochromogenes TaxID=285574 RepID=UPI0036347061
MIASARAAPGDKGDTHLWRKSGLPAAAAGTAVIADGAYLGTGLIVPHRRRAGRRLLRGQEEGNAEHRRVRDRQKGDGLHHAVQAVAVMHDLATAR